MDEIESELTPDPNVCSGPVCWTTQHAFSLSPARRPQMSGSNGSGLQTAGPHKDSLSPWPAAKFQAPEGPEGQPPYSASQNPLP